MLWLFLFVFYFALTLHLASRRQATKNSRLPPGPVGVPVLGYLPFLDVFHLGKSFSKLVDKFGDVFSLRVGTELAVVLNSESSVRDAFSRPELLARPDTFMFRFFSMGGNRGLASSSGDAWEAQRRFAHSALKRLGFGRERMEALMMEEVAELCELFSEKSRSGRPVEVGNDVNVSVVNSVWSLVAGERRQREDPKLRDFLQAVNRGIELASSSAVLLFAPWLAKVLPEWLLGVAEMREMRDRTHDFLREVVEEHRLTRTPGDPRDFIDAFLDESERPGCHPSFNDPLQLVVVCSELFGAGAEPTSVTIRWALRFLAANPRVQRRAQAEIDSVVGRGRPVAPSDKEALPYVRATVQDAIRLSDIHPVGVLHAPSEDVEIDKLRVPKNAFVFPNFHRIHRDPETWERPDELHPDHWLDGEDGSFRPKRPGFVSFGVGRRRCPGREVASSQLFCFLSNLLQRFSFELVPGDDGSCTDTTVGIVVGPKPYQLVIKERS